jgi:cell division control protein 7
MRGEKQRLLEDALDLLEKCLEPSSVRRCTARDALYHSFLAPDVDEREHALQVAESTERDSDPIVLDEDECFPHPPGEGRCQMHHEQDPETGDWKVFIGLDEHGHPDWQTIEAGEGQAIGSRPCEFHRDFEYPETPA